MHATQEPAKARYHTHVQAVTRPDGTTTTRPEEEELMVVEATDADTAARITAWAFISTELPGKPVGWTLHVHVIGPPPTSGGRGARHWTVDVYIDAEAQILH